MSKAKRSFLTLIFIILNSSVLAVQYQHEQYKRQGLNVIAAAVDGKGIPYIEPILRYLEEHPDDLESMYLLTVLYTQQGEQDKAMEWMKRALDKGLPIGRFIAGPRDLLRPLHESKTFREVVDMHMDSHAWDKVIHGPLLGNVTDTSAQFWIRTDQEVTIRLEGICVGSPFDRLETIPPEATTLSENDYTTVLTLQNLRPGKQYLYYVFVDEIFCRGGLFRTFPSAGKGAIFSIGFGGGAGYTPQHERMWSTISSHNLTAFLFLGDNVYIDQPEKPAAQKYCYYRRQSQPWYREFVSRTPIYAIWDDHDFVDDDGRGGPQIEIPAWKRKVWEVFKQNWANPSYGRGRTYPGCWFDFMIADVHFIMLDGRYYRENPKGNNPSMLGPFQKKWLKETLKKSSSAFKILVSPVPWAMNTKPGSLDTWDGYATERKEIFTFIEQNKIEGILLLSADRHRSDLWKIERPNGYDFYEFESSRLTNIHKHGPQKGSLFSYNEKCSFGKLTFDTVQSNPQVNYEIYNIDNQRVYTFTIKHSQLEL
ncbi:MAG: alkaline phosphatase D family protein [Sedimentisphaerales bacterium]|nr:alkaline phosphatase D family protein [Sedimentisphaerales bacterium]